MKATIYIGLSVASALLGSDLVAQQADVDHFSLVLTRSDLQESNRLLTIYDTNDDGTIDEKEKQRLPWKLEFSDHDINNDKTLTHLELSIRCAKQRDKDNITQFDINNVNRFLTRFDKNRNGQLDKNEIKLGGWPSNSEEFDKNGDGVLTKWELAIRFAFLRGLRRELGIEAVDIVGAARILRQFDKDNDRMLNESERVRSSLPSDSARDDQNGDKLLDQTEIATSLARDRMDSGLSNSDMQQANRIFQILDPQGKGRIKLEGYESFARQSGSVQLDQDGTVDANGDGFVTLSEIKKLLVKQRNAKGYSDDDLDYAKKILLRYDKNRSNKLEKHELDETGVLSWPKVKSSDIDKDDSISLEELARHKKSQ